MDGNIGEKYRGCGRPVEEYWPTRSLFEVAFADLKQIVGIEIRHYRFPIHSHLTDKGAAELFPLRGINWNSM